MSLILTSHKYCTKDAVSQYTPNNVHCAVDKQALDF